MSGFTPSGGQLARADFIRDELKDTIPCRRCGFRLPVRIGPDMDGKYGCNSCVEYARCYLCRRWTFEEHGAAISRNVDMDGAIRAICDPCFEKGDEGIDMPLDYTEETP